MDASALRARFPVLEHTAYLNSGTDGPLPAARRRGVNVRVVPFAQVAEAVGPETTLVAVSHVSWIGGEVAPAALEQLDVPVVLDGAQGAGAIHVDPAALGCVAYAAAGQKWLCGADGTGLLWLDPAFAEKLALVTPGYVNFADPAAGFESGFKDTAARFDAPVLPREGLAMSAAAIRVLEEAGWDEVHER